MDAGVVGIAVARWAHGLRARAGVWTDAWSRAGARSHDWIWAEAKRREAAARWAQTWSERRALRAALAARLTAPIVVDQRAALLAAPLAMALGAALYLGLDAEPPSWPAWTLAVAAATGWVVARRRGEGRLGAWPARVAALVAFFAFGFALTDARVAALEGPRVAEGGASYQVEGWVERIDASSAGRRRYWVRVARLDGASVGVPERVRFTAPLRDGEGPQLGDAVRARAVLDPPKGPPTPGAYDFSRAAYFNRLGGSGYALGAITAAPDLVIEGELARGRSLARFRGVLSARLAYAGGADAQGRGAGGVLAALITGDRSGIPPATTQALRDAGLGHILAISGLHLALVGGGCFFALSWALAAVEPLARRMNTRKLAAGGALVISLAYLVVSGAATPTQRAFVMAAVMFGAILVDRRSLSLRGVAIAALVVLALAPESGATPGFQMSFAAAVALVAANDVMRERRRARGFEPKEPGVVGASRRFLGGLSSTSLIAGLATGPFAAYHFNRIAVLGFGANLLAMPVFTALVMPAAVLAGVLSLVGLEAAPAWVAARGIDIVVAIAERTAAHPAAVAPAAAAPPLALALAAIALVAAAVVARGRLRVAAPLALVAFIAWQARPPGALWLGESGGWVARVETDAGPAWVGALERGESYGAELFTRRGGGEEDAMMAASASDTFACDAEGCVGVVGGRTIAIAERWSGVLEDCARADVVLTPGPPSTRIAARCAGARLIERRGRGDHGAVIDLAREEPRLVAAGGAHRPWRTGTGG